MAIITKKYNELKGKYNLPDYKELEKAFELDTLEESDYVLREIRYRISDKFHDVCHMIGDFLQAEASISTLYESGHINDADKDRIFDAYKKTKYFSRRANKLAMLNDEKQDAEFIIDAANNWPMLSIKLAEVFDMLAEAWAKEAQTSEFQAYFG